MEDQTRPGQTGPIRCKKKKAKKKDKVLRERWEQDLEEEHTQGQ